MLKSDNPACFNMYFLLKSKTVLDQRPFEGFGNIYKCHWHTHTHTQIVRQTLTGRHFKIIRLQTIYFISLRCLSCHSNHFLPFSYQWTQMQKYQLSTSARSLLLLPLFSDFGLCVSADMLRLWKFTSSRTISTASGDLGVYFFQATATTYAVVPPEMGIIHIEFM